MLHNLPCRSSLLLFFIRVNSRHSRAKHPYCLCVHASCLNARPIPSACSEKFWGRWVTKRRTADGEGGGRERRAEGGGQRAGGPRKGTTIAIGDAAALHPGGMAAISRGLSAATPPVGEMRFVTSNPEGSRAHRLDALRSQRALVSASTRCLIRSSIRTVVFDKPHARQQPARFSRRWLGCPIIWAKARFIGQLRFISQSRGDETFMRRASARLR